MRSPEMDTVVCWGTKQMYPVSLYVSVLLTVCWCWVSTVVCWDKINVSVISGCWMKVDVYDMCCCTHIWYMLDQSRNSFLFCQDVKIKTFDARWRWWPGASAFMLPFFKTCIAHFSSRRGELQRSSFREILKCRVTRAMTANKQHTRHDLRSLKPAWAKDAENTRKSPTV